MGQLRSARTLLILSSYPTSESRRFDSGLQYFFDLPIQSCRSLDFTNALRQKNSIHRQTDRAECLIEKVGMEGLLTTEQGQI